MWNTCGMRMIHLTLEIHIPIPRGLRITHYCATTSGRRCSGHAPVRLLSAALRRGKDALAALRQVTELQTHALIITNGNMASLWPARPLLSLRVQHANAIIAALAAIAHRACP